jgi:nucleoside-diphosphate-sugar epimerase
VLIHAAADYQHDTVELDRKTIDAFLEAGHHGAQPKTIIYTSGCWVNGDTGTELVDETTPLNPIEAVLWRPEHEQMILEADHVKGIVVRPGCIYGGQGGLTGDWFEGAEKGNMEIVGDGTNIWTMVHVEDNANAYVRAAESGLSGEVFNISDRSRWSVGDMAEAAARVVGYDEAITCIPEEEAAEELGSMAEALAVNQHVDSRKAVRLLGWQPKHGGFVDDVESYYTAWKAHQK